MNGSRNVAIKDNWHLKIATFHYLCDQSYLSSIHYPFFAPTEIAWNKRLNNNILINTLLTFFLQNQPILFFDSAKITYFDQTCTYIKFCEEKKANIEDLTNVLIWALQITCIFILHIWLSEIKDIRGQKRMKKRNMYENETSV